MPPASAAIEPSPTKVFIEHSAERFQKEWSHACLLQVRYLLEAEAEVDHETDKMYTALMKTSMVVHLEVARLLLDSGPHGNIPTLELIKSGANIKEPNDEGYTPLLEAARKGQEVMVALL